MLLSLPGDTLGVVASHLDIERIVMLTQTLKKPTPELTVSLAGRLCAQLPRAHDGSVGIMHVLALARCLAPRAARSVCVTARHAYQGLRPLREVLTCFPALSEAPEIVLAEAWSLGAAHKLHVDPRCPALRGAAPEVRPLAWDLDDFAHLMCRRCHVVHEGWRTAVTLHTVSNTYRISVNAQLFWRALLGVGRAVARTRSRLPNGARRAELTSVARGLHMPSNPVREFGATIARGHGWQSP
jgi:hypothetical protein